MKGNNSNNRSPQTKIQDCLYKEDLMKNYNRLGTMNGANVLFGYMNLVLNSN